MVNTPSPGPHPIQTEPYKGQTTQELLALKHECFPIHLVFAFEEGLSARLEREGPDALTLEERTVVAAERVDSCLSNGGFVTLVSENWAWLSEGLQALDRIGSRDVADWVRRVLKELEVEPTTPAEVVEQKLKDPDTMEVLQELEEDHPYDTPVPNRLLEFIEENVDRIRLP